MTTPTQAIPIEALRGIADELEHVAKQVMAVEPSLEIHLQAIQITMEVQARKLREALSQFAIPVAQPENAWPKCKWCGTDLERFIKDAGRCPSCYAVDWMELAAQPAAEALAAARNALEQVEWVESEYDGRTYSVCPWCKADNLPGRELKHKKGCQREFALAELSKLGKEKP